MRIFLIIAISGFLSLGINAQHVLTATNANPQVGDVFHQDLAQNVTNFDPGPAGANVDWDFSGFTAPDTTVINVKAATDPDYPQADIYFTQAGADAYFSTSNLSFKFYGFDAAQVRVKFTDPEDQIRYPFTYGDSFTDTKAGNTNGFGQSARRSGTIEVEGDGYGTLITPDGNYPNVLRVKFVRHDTDYFAGTPINISTDTIYYWFTDQFRFPVMSYVSLWQNGNQAYTAATYLQDNTFAQAERIKPTAAVYPNPTSGKINLEGIASESEISLYNLEGKLLERLPFQKVIDLSNYEAGVYILKIETAEGTMENLRLVRR